jgi:hypothetical protein
MTGGGMGVPWRGMQGREGWLPFSMRGTAPFLGWLACAQHHLLVPPPILNEPRRAPGVCDAGILLHTGMLAYLFAGTVTLQTPDGQVTVVTSEHLHGGSCLPRHTGGARGHRQGMPAALSAFDASRMEQQGHRGRSVQCRMRATWHSLTPAGSCRI